MAFTNANSLRHDKLIESAVLMINHKDTKSEVCHYMVV